MTKITRILLLATFCAVSGLAHAADVAGTWTASFDTQVGKQEYTYTLKVDGNKISFVEKGTYQGMPLQFNYTGEIAGDEIRFKRELMGFPAEEFVAKRSK